MTNEEKALEIGTNNALKYWFGKDEQEEKIISSVQSAIKMAEWKDQQFKESLEKELNDMFCQLCLDYSIPDTIADEYIGKLNHIIFGE